MSPTDENVDVLLRGRAFGSTGKAKRKIEPVPLISIPKIIKLIVFFTFVKRPLDQTSKRKGVGDPSVMPQIDSFTSCRGPTYVVGPNVSPSNDIFPNPGSSMELGLLLYLLIEVGDRVD
ncbi:hypothetical protein HAX54_012621 [Datura stramonium]|uniref:Uncharacterized protein n=1 Tax=Datura stramonium TaxID=4076 RepID=A0ABS8RXS7_DATST|nr:hypothetical protein [Datura stramonium]